MGEKLQAKTIRRLKSDWLEASCQAAVGPAQFDIFMTALDAS